MTFVHLLYDPCERFFFHLFAKMPPAIQPYAGDLFLLLFILLYVWAIYLMGRCAEKKGQRFWLGVWIGILATPFAGSVLLAYLNEAPVKIAKPKPRKRSKAS